MWRSVPVCGLLAGLLAGCPGGGSGAPDASPPDAPIVDAPPFTAGVSTLAGAADAGRRDGDRNVARFANPVNVAVGPDGRAYVADFDNGLIRVVDDTGLVTTALSWQGFERPFALAFAPDGTLYASTDNDDAGGHSAMSGTIWKVDVSAHTAAVVVRDIGRPRGLGVLADGRLVLSDYVHHVIEVLDPSSGQRTTLAGVWDMPGYDNGKGAAARFDIPYGLAVDGDMIVVADFGNNRIRAVSAVDGTTITLAGTGLAQFQDGPAGSACFDHPQGVAIDDTGAIYITDTDNYRVRLLANDQVETIAGDGVAGYKDADDRLAAELFGLEGLAVRPDGTRVYVADGSRGEDLPYNRVRIIDLTQ